MTEKFSESDDFVSPEELETLTDFRDRYGDVIDEALLEFGATDEELIAVVRYLFNDYLMAPRKEYAYDDVVEVLQKIRSASGSIQ